MRRNSVVLLVAYATGLVALTTTKHGDSIRLGLAHLGLLKIEPGFEEPCQVRIPFVPDVKLFSGKGLRSCNGVCDDTCETNYLFMHDNGKLTLYQPGANSNNLQVMWQASSRPWWRPAVVSDEFWAVIRQDELQIGKGDEVVWKRKLSRCKRLLEKIVSPQTI